MQGNKGYADELISVLEKPRGSSSASFENTNSFLDNTTYFIDVSPCFGHLCLNSTSSDGFRFNPKPLATKLRNAVIDLQFSVEHVHPKLNASWELMSHAEDHQILEQWTLCLDVEGRENILNWTSVRNELEV
jgi:hypothetical protein